MVSLMKATYLSPLYRHLIALLLTALLTGCGPESTTASTPVSENTSRPEAADEPTAKQEDLDASSGSKTAAAQYRTIEWIDLMPEDDMNALLSPPEYLAEIEDGSPEDQSESQNPDAISLDSDPTAEQIEKQIGDAIASASDSRYQQALVDRKSVV